MNTSLSAFASALWNPDDTIELRAIFPRELKADAPPPRSVWLKASEIAAGSADGWGTRLNGEGWGIYAGVNPRKGPGGRDGAAVARCPALFVDFDGGATPDEVLTIVSDKCLPEPSIIVATGHGVHAYWLVEGGVDLVAWSGLQRALIGVLGTDPAIHDLPRVARLPGFTNTKPPAAEAVLVVCEPSRRYGLSSFPAVNRQNSGANADKTPAQNGSIHNLSRTTLDFIVAGAAEGERNHRLFSAACDMAGNGLGESEAEARLLGPATACGLAEPEARRTIHSAYQRPREPARRVGGATVKDEQEWGEVGPEPYQPKPRFSNVVIEVREVVDTNTGKSKTVENTVFVPWPKVAESLREITGGWPKSIGGMPFAIKNLRPGVVPNQYNIDNFSQFTDLFAWIGGVSEPYWCEKHCYSEEGGKRTPPTKAEFFKEVRRSGEAFDAVSCLPHEPPIPGVFYIPWTPPEATGERLAEFMAKLNPATETDRRLLRAMILTPFWGGPCGARPAFVLRSRFGRGTGKTATAIAIADIAGGHFDIDQKEEWEKVQKRIMADDAIQQRIALVDNVRGRLDSSYLESLVTAKKITGWRMYYGNLTRANYTTLFLTSNTPKLSHDLAVRAVIIDIGRQRHAEGFVSWVADFVEAHRAALIADILADLRTKPVETIRPENRDRFQAWQDGVLTRIQGSNELAAEIKARRGSADGDAETTETVAKAIVGWLRSKSIDPGRGGEPIKITRDEMFNLIKNAGALPAQDMNKNGLHSWLVNMLGTDGALAPLTDSSSRKDGRVWLWDGSLWEPVDDSDLPPV